MCGITAVCNFEALSAKELMNANALIAHRGPDDEGFFLWNADRKTCSFAGQDTAQQSVLSHTLAPPSLVDSNWTVGLGHRRLSILDLSPAGHQPMTLNERYTITYNGEVYNYIELRTELELLGHIFKTSTDTEVLLTAWKEWGIECLHKFNGMFAFVLFDRKEQKLYAIRDRFGVKPLFYTHTKSYIAFSSEAKQLRILPEYQFSLNHKIAYDYLCYGLVDHDVQTFEEGILQVAPGYYAVVDIVNKTCTTHQWYNLKPKPYKGTEKEACAQFYELLKDSVRLRTRSDVPLGSALSGGLDSSTIVCLMSEILTEQRGQVKDIETVTSCHEDKKYDEWEYAEEIIAHTHAKSYKVFPSFESLTKDFDSFLWHMDYPFASSSQYSQWCVFKGAKQAGLTVMIDGQGADEQLAGYGGNDMSLYIGLLKNGKLRELVKEVKAYKSYKGQWPLGFMIGAIQTQLPRFIMDLVPDKYRVFKNNPPVWLQKNNKSVVHKWPESLKDSLIKQVAESPLPSLLRYEDRSSMAFSIESRVPFMDYRLVEFTLSLPEHFVYRRGERKYILRKSFEGIVPHKILARKDKMGFVSAEERWLKQEGKTWFKDFIALAKEEGNGFIKKEALELYVTHMQQDKVAFTHEPWRVICFYKWLQAMSNKAYSQPNS